MLKRKEKIYQHWSAIMERYAQSKLSQEKFCEQENISFRKFKYYRYRLSKACSSKNDPKSNTLLPVHITPGTQTKAYEGFEILLPNHISIKISSNITLLKLSELIRELCSCG